MPMLLMRTFLTFEQGQKTGQFFGTSSATLIRADANKQYARPERLLGTHADRCRHRTQSVLDEYPNLNYHPHQRALFGGVKADQEG